MHFTEPHYLHFWRPNANLVPALLDTIGDKKVLEVFAGNGYLASLLKEKGIAITSTTVFSSHDAHEIWKNPDVIEADAISAVLTFQKRHDMLLFCWPTVTEDAMRALQLWGTEKPVIFIGEMPNPALGPAGLMQGCATDSFFEAFEVKSVLPYHPTNMLEKAVLGYYKPL